MSDGVIYRLLKLTKEYGERQVLEIDQLDIFK